MATSVDAFDSLAAELSRSSTVEAKIQAFTRWSKLNQDILPVIQYNRHVVTKGDVGPALSQDRMKMFTLLCLRNGMSPELMQGFYSRSSGYPDLVLDTIPCANHETQPACGNAVTSTCSGCQIVRYCSKVRDATHVEDIH
jgi:hypothetical protein